MRRALTGPTPILIACQPRTERLGGRERRRYEISVHGAPPVGPATFITVETWNSQDEFNEHMQTPYVQHAFETAGDHVTQAPVIHPLTEV
jgi:hypothetical protein